MNPPLAAAAPRQNGPNARAKRGARRWLPYAGGVLLIVLIVAGLWPQPVPVETARVSVGPLRASIDEEGKTRIRQRYVVSAPVTGLLRRLELKPGAPVTAGQTVAATLDPVPPTLLDARSRSLAEARRGAAAANLLKVRAAHTFALSELGRIEKLRASSAVAAQELEAAQWRETSAAREATAAQSQLLEAEAELAEFTAAEAAAGATNRAPVSVMVPATGRVLRVFQESSRVVAGGTPLLEVGDATDLELVIEVLSRDGARLAPGTPVELDQWGGPEPLRAKVRLVEPAAFTKVSALGVEEQRVNVIADLLTPPEQRPQLGDNFRVEASIILWRLDRALKVPMGALSRRGEDWAAFVVQGGRAQLRPVKARAASGAEAHVLEGLHEGDEVILYPGDRVRNGQRVRPFKV